MSPAQLARARHGPPHRWADVRSIRRGPHARLSGVCRDVGPRVRPRPRGVARQPRPAAARTRRRPRARLPRRDRQRPRRAVVGRADSRRPPGPPGRDHRAGGPEDGHQRDEFRRQRLHGRFRGFATRRRGPARSKGNSTSATPSAARSPTTAPRGSTTRWARRRRRSWSAPAAGTCTRSTSGSDGKPVPASLFDFGVYFFHNAQTLIDRGTGPYFYLPKLESHLEARLWNDVFQLTQDELGIPRGTILRHGADRDDPGGVRDGGDPLRVAGALGGAQLRAVGLHLQHHQEVPRQPGVHSARPRRGHHDHAHDALLLAPGDPDVPSPRGPRHRRHGRADPDQGRSAGQRSGPGQGPRRQGPRGYRRPRRHLGRASRAGRLGQGGVRRTGCRGPTRSTASGTTSR